MRLKEMGDYHVGQSGWIDVFDCDGKTKRVEGEIISLISTGEETVVYALIRTRSGTGVYRVW